MIAVSPEKHNFDDYNLLMLYNFTNILPHYVPLFTYASCFAPISTKTGFGTVKQTDINIMSYTLYPVRGTKERKSN